MIGREKEQRRLREMADSGEAEFVAVYGRRRIVKTYLINEFFAEKLFFQHAGLSPVEAKDAPERTQLEAQLNHFVRALRRQGAEITEEVRSWGDAFFQLEVFLTGAIRRKRIVIFLDELPDFFFACYIHIVDNNFLCALRQVRDSLMDDTLHSNFIKQL